MATDTIQISGLAKWVKHMEPDNKFAPPTYQLNIYPDTDSKKVYKASGLKVKYKEDEDGEFLKFKRKQEDGRPFTFLKGEKDFYDKAIGNGSIVTAKIEVYDTKSFGKGHRLEAIRIDKLVEYVPEGGEKKARKPAMPF